MRDRTQITQIGVQMPKELKRDLQLELIREGRKITGFVIEQARKYLAEKQVRLSTGNKRKAS